MRMQPDDAGGIIAVGLTSGDSTGIEAQAGGADGTAPMVLTRKRQCHPSPAGIGWRGIGAPAPEQNEVLLYLVYSEISGNGILWNGSTARTSVRSGERFQKFRERSLSDRERSTAAAGADRNAPQRFR